MSQVCTVVVLNWNGWRDTLACVDSLFAGDCAGLRVVVCDNGSTDGSLAALASAFAARHGARWRASTREALARGEARPEDAALWLIDNGANLGFAAGNNVGIAFALAEPACGHVWVLNNDTEVAPDALAQALAYMRRRPDVGLCGSTLVYHHDRRTVQAFGGSTYTRWSGRTRHIGAFERLADAPADGAAVEAQMACVVGAAMLASRGFLETVGPMREDYFLYFEEMDWAARARGRYALGYAPASVVYHKEGAAIGTASAGGSPLSVHYLFRNRVRFAWRFHRAWSPLVVAVALFDVGRFVARRRWSQARAAIGGLLQRSTPAVSAATSARR